MVDEASLAGTFALGELGAIAADAGAKLVLVGDPYQFPLSKREGCSVPWCFDSFDLVAALTDIRRFRAGGPGCSAAAWPLPQQG
jgi:AAA domain